MPVNPNEPQIIEGSFSQKKINHVFHYNNNFKVLLKILSSGFAPSYCKEVISDFEYYIPMVSFCNIPIRDADLYMRYGKYGIGMSINWALKNGISPVVYVHDNTPFRNFHSEINKVHVFDYVDGIITRKMNAVLARDEFEVQEETGESDDLNDKKQADLLKRINDITVPTLQFFKNWKTTYKGDDIITYQEREWRFIPDLRGSEHNRLMTVEEFEKVKRQYLLKPHLPKFSLNIDSIKDIRYVMIHSDDQRGRVLRTLISRFSEEEVNRAILSGNLLVITNETIRNDF